MASLKEEAQAYEPQQTRNIAEIGSVPVEIEIVDKEFINNDGKPFTIKVITVEGVDYRVPKTVLKSLKVILEDNPNLKRFKVRRTGEGMKDTVYTVIPLE